MSNDYQIPDYYVDDFCILLSNVSSKRYHSETHEVLNSSSHSLNAGDLMIIKSNYYDFFRNSAEPEYQPVFVCNDYDDFVLLVYEKNLFFFSAKNS